MTDRPGVSFVVPVYNGRRWLPQMLDGIDAQRDGRDFEVIAVEDGSRDGSRRFLEEAAAAGRLTLIDGPRRGSAAALNAGIRQAAHPIVCQIDQDVVLQPGWLSRVLEPLEDPEVAAAQGHYVPAAGARFWARTIGRDLQHRYAQIRGEYVDHVCTGNTAYRASALHQVGLFDERFGYASDNDLSYRLTDAGYRLAFCRDAFSVHYWREDPVGYLRQQFGQGYGRLELLARHPQRIAGDDVSGAIMMAHGPLMLLAIVLAAAALACSITAVPSSVASVTAGGIVLFLFLERLAAGIATWRRSKDAAALAFCVTHLLRDLAWSWAIVRWTMRRLLGHRSSPAHSMTREPAVLAGAVEAVADSGAVLALVPAYNEAPNLHRVVHELRWRAPSIDILIVNDGSTDQTADLLPTLGVQWLTLPQRVGVGSAVRAGLRYAAREGYDYVVRIDGDGQHRACDIGRLLTAVTAGQLDAVIGSRFLGRRGLRITMLRASQAALARCLTLLTRRKVTDPTSGFWVFGPRAVRLLGRHHPTGYAEPELVLFLCRNGLRVGEVPIRIRPRLAGRTSLTPGRATVALARTLLALMIVPMRRMVEGHGHD